MSHSDIDPDDPRLTAYALGELEAAEREAVERLMATSPAIRAEIEQTRLLAHALTAEYDREREDYALDYASENQPANLIPFPTAAQRRRTRRSRTLLQVAATLMVLAGLAVWGTNRSLHPLPAKTVAMQTDSTARPVPLAVATPEELQTLDMVAPAPTPRNETAATEPPLALEKSLARAEFSGDLDKQNKDALDRREIPMPAAPAAAPQASAPLLALRAPARRASETPESASGGAAVAGAVSKASRSASQRSLTLPSTVDGKTPDEVSAGTVSTLSDALTRNDTEGERRLTASLVRVRGRDGKTTAGVVIAPNGLVLETALVAPSEELGSLNVTSGEGAVYEVLSSHPVPGSDLVVLKINASGLTAVALTGAVPSENDPVILAHIEKDTGKVKNSRRKFASYVSPASAGHPAAPGAPPTGENGPVDFAFDAEFRLVGIKPVSVNAKEKQEAVKTPAFRLLSKGERETLTRLISTGEQ